MRKIVCLTAVLFLCSPVWAQESGQQQPPPQQPEPRPEPRPRPEQPREQQPDFTRTPDSDRRFFEDRISFIVGKVAMEDGTAPPESVQVEIVCHGQVRLQQYTHSRGDFSIQLGGDNPRNTVVDASVSGADGVGFGGDRNALGGRGGRTDLTGCELRASLAGFRSDTIDLSFRRPMDNPDVGTLVLYRLANVTATTVSFNTLSAPRNALRAYENGKKELARDKPRHDRALRELQKAVDAYPEFAAAWNLIGKTKLGMDDREGAREAFQKSFEADPEYLDPYLALAHMEVNESHWPQVVRLTNTIVSKNPYVMQARFFNAVANYQLGLIDAAEASILEIKNSNQAGMFPMSYYLMGAILATRGDFNSAAEEFRQLISMGAQGPVLEELQKTLKQWEAEGRIQPAPPESQ